MVTAGEGAVWLGWGVLAGAAECGSVNEVTAPVTALVRPPNNPLGELPDEVVVEAEGAAEPAEELGADPVLGSVPLTTGVPSLLAEGIEVEDELAAAFVSLAEP